VRALASLSANAARNPAIDAERVVGPMAGRLSGRGERMSLLLALRSPQRRNALENLDAI
jgi:hypothetical protein